MKIDLHNHSIAFPFAFEISEDSEKDFSSMIKKWKYTNQKKHTVLFITGGGGQTTGFIKKYEEILRAADNSIFFYYKVFSGSMKEVRDVDAFCAINSVTLIVAIGGGKVIDVAKMVVGARAIALVIIPSVLSSDCIASPISVLINDNGVTESFPSGIPSCLFIDLSLTAQAPRNLTLSGIGDIISNASALIDLEDYESSAQSSISGFSKILSESAYKIILSLTPEDIESADSNRKIAMGLILSGLAMAFSGNSQPCSGGEHLISHAIDKLGYGTGTHGIQVAVGTMYCAALRDILVARKIDNEVISFIKKIGLHLHPAEIGISREEFIEAVHLAPTTRQNRVTILSRVTTNSLLEAAYCRAFSEIEIANI